MLRDLSSVADAVSLTAACLEAVLMPHASHVAASRYQWTRRSRWQTTSCASRSKQLTQTKALRLRWAKSPRPTAQRMLTSPPLHPAPLLQQLLSPQQPQGLLRQQSPPWQLGLLSSPKQPPASLRRQRAANRALPERSRTVWWLAMSTWGTMPSQRPAGLPRLR